jgi:hypothetical protein
MAGMGHDAQGTVPVQVKSVVLVNRPVNGNDAKSYAVR